MLQEDKQRPKKQRHTAQRIFDRLRDEHGYDGGVTIVRNYVRGQKPQSQEMLVPLSHPPGDAQMDCGEQVHLFIIPVLYSVTLAVCWMSISDGA
jgi:transposase